ncbi:MAG: archaemetzincin family Zn-dependent metalloprotease [Deltaproteobacteria bacterium]|nr:archaemetzincin family Zn-dependent metalloprotease [Deltaproteobacteria bacterium]MBW2140363.1 archaemetzincin family Zn-dependent metalloprotease [Deltaproteobacteria bacterium]
MPEDNFIGLRPYGQIDLDILEVLVKELRQLFPFPIVILEACAPPDFAYDRGRQQYLAKAILNDLVKNAPQGCKRIAGLTDVDLFLPILTFVYGEAMLPGQAAVVSTYRLSGKNSENPVPFEMLAKRVVKEVVHELGHTFNLVHCDNKDCVMSFAHELDHIDKKAVRFCRYCSVLFSDALGQGL